MNGKGIMAIVGVAVTILLATLLNWVWISDVSTAIAGNKILLEKHNKDENLHLQKGEDGLPVMVTRGEFNELKESVDTQNNLLIIMAVKQGIDVSKFIKKE